MHGVASIVVLILVIPLLFWSGRRRVRRMSQSADRWSKPVDGGFVVQPYGRFGKAYVVSAGVREQIRKKYASLFTLVILALGITYLAPLMLSIFDADIYWHIRPWIAAIRICVLLAFIPIIPLWTRLAIGPLLVNAPLSPERITMAYVSTRVAQEKSWATIVLTIVTSLVLAVISAAAAVETGRLVFYSGTLLFGAGALLYLRYADLKRRNG